MCLTYVNFVGFINDIIASNILTIVVSQCKTNNLCSFLLFRWISGRAIYNFSCNIINKFCELILFSLVNIQFKCYVIIVTLRIHYIKTLNSYKYVDMIFFISIVQTLFIIIIEIKQFDIYLISG